MTQTPQDLPILLIGGDDLVDVTCAGDAGGRASMGLGARIEEQSDGAITPMIVHHRFTSVTDIEAGIGDVDVPDGSIALLSVGCALDEAVAEAEPDAWFATAMAGVIASLQRRGAHVIAVNGSTYDPDDDTSCYRDGIDRPALTLHWLDIALIELSVLDGISIVDADRIVAEVSGHRAVERLLTYTTPGADAICAEIVRIVDDYRFLQPGPLVPQSGRRV